MDKASRSEREEYLQRHLFNYGDARIDKMENHSKVYCTLSRPDAEEVILSLAIAAAVMCSIFMAYLMGQI